MSGTVRWFVDRDDAGIIGRVVRVRDDDEGLHGEYFRAGSWVPDNAVLAVLQDPGWGLPVTAEEGEAAVAELQREG